MWLIPLFFCGCLPPTGKEHQKSHDLCAAIEKNSVIIEELRKSETLLTGAFGTAVPPNILIDIYFSEILDSSSQAKIIKEITNESNKMSIKNDIVVTFNEGDLSSRINFLKITITNRK